MSMIYLDNAATSYPKPEAVYRKNDDVLRHRSGNPGRGTHTLAMLAEEEVYRCRETVASFFGVTPERVVFTYNTTYALNMAMKTAYRHGTVFISDLEHNSVRRPAVTLTNDVRIFPSCLNDEPPVRTQKIMDNLKKTIGRTREGIVICTAASNICGATMPIREIGQLCRERGFYFIVDGAQAGGCLDIQVDRDNIDALCLPAHKGLLGVQGVGLLLLGSQNKNLRTWVEGGSGLISKNITMPSLPPERFEAGTLAVAPIAALTAGLEFISSVTVDAIRRHEENLTAYAYHNLREQLHDKIRFYYPELGGTILSFNLCNRSPTETARLLDDNEICTRDGLHCAALAHQTIGSDGTVRISPGYFNTYEDIERLTEVLWGIS